MHKNEYMCAHMAYNHVLETIFCTHHDGIEVLCPTPALFTGFGSNTVHDPVVIELEFQACTSKSQPNLSTSKLDFSKANYEALSEKFISTD